MRILSKVLGGVLFLVTMSSETGFSLIPPDGLYFGQSPPGLTPEVFAPGIISLEDRYEYTLVFSPELDECVFGVTDRTWGVFTLMYTRMDDDSSWIEPVDAPFQGSGDGLLPAYSPDANRIFFVSSRPSWPTVNVWYSERVDTLWSDPVELPSPVNTNSAEFGLSLASDATLYFTSDRSSGFGQQDIYRSTPVGGEYSSLEHLGSPINTLYNDASPYIAPDQSYLIFESNQPGGYGQVDLYISSFEDGIWTDPVNLGPEINTEQIDDAAGVSPDGKYLFFNRRRAYVTNEQTDIYWVDIRAVFPDSGLGTGETGGSGFPRLFTLDQNYPNPFNPTTRIDYYIRGSGTISLMVYDLSGKLVRRLDGGVKPEGKSSVVWDGRNDRGIAVPSGVYFYTLKAEGHTITKKLLLLK